MGEFHCHCRPDLNYQCPLHNAPMTSHTPTPPAVDDGLVERLREYEGSDALGNGDFSLLYEAADALSSLRAQLAEMKAERDFLLARSGRAGSVSFSPGRWTGASSNALVTVAFGGEDPTPPHDGSDLAACYLTVMRLPAHRRTAAVFDQLERGERELSEEERNWARETTEWPGRQALTAASPDVEAGPVVQFRKAGCADWYDGYPDNQDGGGPYETRTLYTHPPKASPPATEIEARLRKTAADMIGNYDGEHDHWAELLTEAADALATKDREIAQAWREGWDAAKTLPLTDDLAQARNEALEEAANACDVSAEGWREAGFYNRSFGANDCATVIRNLKSPAIEGERNND